MLMYDNVKQLIKESRIESMRHLKDIFSSVIKRGLEGEVYLAPSIFYTTFNNRNTHGRICLVTG